MSHDCDDKQSDARPVPIPIATTATAANGESNPVPTPLSPLRPLPRYLILAGTALPPPPEPQLLSQTASSPPPASASVVSPLSNLRSNAIQNDAVAVDARLLSIGFVADAGSITKAEITKPELIRSLTAFLACDAPLHVLCWFGHGAFDSGDWLLADGETLSLKELLRLLLNAWFADNKKRHLFVLADSCYSGGWVNSALAMTLNAWPRNQIAFTLQVPVSADDALSRLATHLVLHRPQASVTAKCKADAGTFTCHFWLPFAAGAQTACYTLLSYAERKTMSWDSGLSPAAYSTLTPIHTGLVQTKDVVTFASLEPHRWSAACRALLRAYGSGTAAAVSATSTAQSARPVFDSKRNELDSNSEQKRQIIGIQHPSR